MSDEYQEWIRRAESSLVLSRYAYDESICLEDLCFQAQQAAEKALKALLVKSGVDPIEISSLSQVLNLVVERYEVPSEIESAVSLSEYVEMALYPGDYPPVTRADYEQAVELATSVVEWVRSVVS